MTDTTTQPRKPGRPKKIQELAPTAEARVLTEPATEEHQDVHHTVADAVRILIAALGYEEEDVKGVDLRANGIARVYGTNNSLRSTRFVGWK